LAIVLSRTMRMVLLRVLLLVLCCSGTRRILQKEANHNSDYARDEMQDVVCCIEVREPEKQSIISPVRSGWKVKRGKEPQQSHEDVQDAKDAIEETCLSRESCGETKQSCNQVANSMISVDIEDAENCLDSRAIFCWGEEANQTEDRKDETKCECKYAICGPLWCRSL
jgi:hypothetical protein